ncbi:MAG: hypothetical protein ABIN61_05950 [candidate division WOR-3 bacterium]
MKRLCMLVGGLLLVLVVNADVIIIEEPFKLESFRHQATASIEDDLDNGIDGTDIFKVEGARIYTNLSNLVSGTETQFDNSNSENAVVIGAISPIYKGWKAAIFYGNANYIGSIDNSSTFVDLLNTDTDEPFDVKRTTETITTSNESEDRNCILLNIGKVLGEGSNLALTYKRIGVKTGEDSDETTEYIENDIDNSRITAYQKENENEKMENSIPVNLLALSYTRPYKGLELRGDLYLIMGAMNDEESGFSRFFQDFSPSDAQIDELLDSNLYNSKDNVKENLIGVSLRLGDVNEFGLWELGCNLGMIFGSGDYEYSEYLHEIYRDQIATGIILIDEVENGGTIGSISPSGWNMGLFGKAEWQISPNVRWGVGLIYNNLSGTLKYDLDYSLDNRYTFNNGNGVNDWADSTRTEEGGISLVRTQKLSINNIAIPTGIEISFGKHKDWALRFGALGITSKSSVTSSQEYDENSIQRNTVTTVRGDGSRTETIDDEVVYTDGEATEGSTSRSVYYTYGLGWKPSRDLSLDLIGMFDGEGELLSTDWFKSLKISATIVIR